MSGGLVALLDDIATLAKVTASSVDEASPSSPASARSRVGTTTGG